MKVNRINKKITLILLAFAIGWFSLYAIINFHQHKIFGKELNYNHHPSLCKKEENLVLDLENNRDNDGLDNKIQFEVLGLVSASNELSNIYHFYRHHLNYLSDEHCRLINCSTQDRLRAPPSVS